MKVFMVFWIFLIVLGILFVRPWTAWDGGKDDWLWLVGHLVISGVAGGLCYLAYILP